MDTLRTVLRVLNLIYKVAKLSVMLYITYKFGPRGLEPNNDNNDNDANRPRPPRRPSFRTAPDILLEHTLFSNPNSVQGTLDADDMFRVMIALAMHDLPGEQTKDLYTIFRAKQIIAGDGGVVLRYPCVVLIEERIRMFLNVMRRFTAAMGKLQWRVAADDAAVDFETYDEDWNNIFGHFAEAVQPILGLEGWRVGFMEIVTGEDWVPEDERLIETPLIMQGPTTGPSRLIYELLDGVRDARANELDRVNDAYWRVVAHAKGQFKVLIEVHKALCYMGENDNDSGDEN